MRSPRRSFAASFVVTLAAGCAGSADHEHTNPPVITTTTDHPATPPPPSSTAWRVELQPDGTCVAALDVQCKPATSCNPPRPRPYVCPAGITADSHYRIVQFGDADCQLTTPMPPCPPNVMCNPPPPQKTDCPHD